MQCTACGTPNEARSLFCESCGAQLPRAGGPVARSAGVPPPRPAPPPARRRTRALPPSEGHDARTQKRVRKYFRKFPILALYFLGIGLLGLLGAVIKAPFTVVENRQIERINSTRLEEARKQDEENRANAKRWGFQPPAPVAPELLPYQPHPIFEVIGASVWVTLGVLIVLWWRHRPPDEEIDALREEACQRVQARALEKLSLDLQEAGMGEPVILTTPQFLDLITGKRFQVNEQGRVREMLFGVRVGRDSVMRYTPIGVDVLVFAPHGLMSFSCVLDLVSGTWSGEATREWFYKDIVSMSTETRSAVIGRTFRQLPIRMLAAAVRFVGVFVPGVKLAFAWLLARFSDVEVFTVCNKGGKEIEIDLGAPALYSELGGVRSADDAQRILNGVRAMLRAFKRHSVEQAA